MFFCLVHIFNWTILFYLETKCASLRRTQSKKGQDLPAWIAYLLSCAWLGGPVPPNTRDAVQNRGPETVKLSE